jgi:hypothetical protein
MIHFCIPLKSRNASKNWKNTQLLLKWTLRSIQNQTNNDFKVLIAFHDEPELVGSFLNNIVSIQAEYPDPTSVNSNISSLADRKRLDKYYKKRLLMLKVSEFGGGFVMFVDGDDLVHRKLAHFINENQDSNGYYFTKGWEFYTDRKLLKFAPKFNNLCGTSAVIKYLPEDLPNVFSFDGYDRLNILRSNNYPFDFGHPEWPQIFSYLNRPLKPLKFIGAVYMMNTGENLSISTSNIGYRRQLIRKIIPPFPIIPKLRRDFSIPNVQELEQLVR